MTPPTVDTLDGRRPGVGVWILLAVGLLAVLVYADSLGNGFALDDPGIIVENPVVTGGDPVVALQAPWWAGEAGVGRLYRPTTQALFAIQWRLFGGAPFGFHAVNVLLHALVSVLVAALCGWLAGIGGGPPSSRDGAALVGGAVFAVHPVHVEAVANVVGQAELWAAVGVVGAVVVHLRTRYSPPLLRISGTLALGALFAVGFGAKEIAVTLPALILLVEAAEVRSLRRLGGRLVAEAPRILLLAAVGLSLLVARLGVLGALAGEDVTAVLAGLDLPHRLARVLPLWVEYVRLLVWPATLSADYDPGVVYPASGPGVAQVVMGAGILVGVLALTVGGWRRHRRWAVATGWFVVALLPVSNLMLSTGSLMAERTLYLPSVGWALVAAAGAVTVMGWMTDAPRRSRRWATGGVVIVIVLLAARTVERNPTWFSSYTVMETLARDHPDSWRARLARAEGLVQVGEDRAAAAAYLAAVDALPTRFDLVSKAGAFFKERRDLDRARPLLERAVELQPTRPSGWVLLAELELIEGRFREAHRVAAAGVAAATPSAGPWRVLSEAYAGGGLLEAAVRARRAVLAIEPGSDEDRRRLAELVAAVEAANEGEPEGGSADGS